MSQYPLFETISIIDGEIQNIEYHQKRYEYALKHYFGENKSFDLARIIQIPVNYYKGHVRCRLSYNSSHYHIEFFHYIPKKIDYFTCVYLDSLEYQFKYTDRTSFDQFPKQEREEIIIIQNNLVTDCSIGNLLFLKHGTWYSPKQYLLKGTQLSRLLDEKRVVLTDIYQKDLFDYQQIMLINALNPFNLARALTISKNTIR